VKWHSEVAWHSGSGTSQIEIPCNNRK